MAKPNFILPNKPAIKAGSILSYNYTDDLKFAAEPLDFSRNGSATRVNEQGLIETTSANMSRIDYSDSSTEPSLLLEPQSTNLFTYSNDFTQDWQGGGAGAFTITSNAVISPDGTLNASKLIAPGPNVGYQLKQNKAIIKTQMSNSFYMRTNQGTRRMSIHINDNELRETFVVTSEWKRYTVSGLVGGTLNGGGRCSLVNLDILDENNHVYIWGAQLEQQSYATSYTPTSGSTATRLGETADNAGSAGVFNSEEGVLYAEYKIGGDSTDSYQIISLRDSTSSDSDVVGIGKHNYTNDIFIRLSIGSVGVFSNLSATPIDGYNKVAISYKSGNSSAWVNGTKVYSSSSTFTPSRTLSELSFQWRSPDQFNFYGKTKDLKVFNYALTDEELQTLTT